MKKSSYTNYEELPLFLNAEFISEILGISISSAYELMHEKDFPYTQGWQSNGCAKRKIQNVGRKEYGRWFVIAQKQ